MGRDKMKCEMGWGVCFFAECSTSIDGHNE